ncbi:MAG: 2-dehydropantoate 2-reductase, partial [Myxococcota bacterium]
LHGVPPGVLELGEGGEVLAAALRDAGFISRVHPKLSEAVNGKLLTNLGGVAQALSGDDPGWIAVAQAAMAEGASILTAAGMPFEGAQALQDRCMARMTMERIGGQARPGGSTWQSVARGRALESRWLNGEIVAIAESIGQDAPINRRLVALSLTPPAVPGSMPAAALLG